MLLAGNLVFASTTTNLDGHNALIIVQGQANLAPTALHFNSTSFRPEAKPEDVIGTLSPTEPDDDRLTYTLV